VVHGVYKILYGSLNILNTGSRTKRIPIPADIIYRDTPLLEVINTEGHLWWQPNQWNT
jgi:hypothetical protein